MPMRKCLLNFEYLLYSMIFYVTLGCGNSTNESKNYDEVCFYSLSYVGQNYSTSFRKGYEILFSNKVEDDCINSVIKDSSFVAEFDVKLFGESTGSLNYWGLGDERLPLNSFNAQGSQKISFLYINGKEIGEIGSNEFDFINTSSKIKDNYFRDTDLTLSLSINTIEDAKRHRVSVSLFKKPVYTEN